MATLRHLEKGCVVLAKMLQGYGVPQVFYVEQMLRRTMVELEKLGIRRIVTHSEKAAAYMADGYARASRKPGVCLAQSVGAANLASGLQDAYLGRSPVIAITGAYSSNKKFRNSYQEVDDHWSMFAPVTKFNASINTAAELPQVIRQAFREAVSGTPRPVHIDMANNVGVTIDTGDVACDLYSEPRFAAVPPFRPAPDPEDVRAAAALIYTARRPVIIAGGGAVMSDAGAEVLQLVERLGIPLGVSVDGKSIIPDTHPLCIGCVGGYGRKVANALLAEADLVLYIGCKVCDQVSLDWKLPEPGTPVIQIDINPAELGRNYPNAASLLGDAKASVAALLREMPDRHANGDWGAKATAALEKWRGELAVHGVSDVVPIRTERLCREVQNALPDNAILVGDTGFSAIWSAGIIELARPGQRYIRAAGGSLGWGFPASLGVKCGCPDRPVVCFSGDGAFWYHFAELETALRHNIATVTVVNNNSGLGQSRRGIMDVYTNQPGRAEDLFQFSAMNFSKFAADLGAFSLRVEKPADIGPAISKALASGRPALVEVLTDIACDPQNY